MTVTPKSDLHMKAILVCLMPSVNLCYWSWETFHDSHKKDNSIHLLFIKCKCDELKHSHTIHMSLKVKMKLYVINHT
jgi:hypothetical protein